MTHTAPHPEDTLITAAMADGIVDSLRGMKVTKEAIEAKIAHVQFLVRGTTTFCFLTVRNGFCVIGEAGCVDPANFDIDVGRRYAYDAAFRKLWPYEGYLLAEARAIHGLQVTIDTETQP